MSTRRGRYKKTYGTPTQSPRPQAIDDWTGFKVNHSDLRLEWDKLRTVDPDIRNPQDFVKGVPDRQNLPWARPEAPNVFLAENVYTEDGIPVMLEDGTPLLTEGETVSSESF